MSKLLGNYYLLDELWNEVGSNAINANLEMTKKIVITSKNTKAIAFFEEISKHKEEIKKKLLANNSSKVVRN